MLRMTGDAVEGCKQNHGREEDRTSFATGAQVPPEQHFFPDSQHPPDAQHNESVGQHPPYASAWELVQNKLQRGRVSLLIPLQGP